MTYIVTCDYNKEIQLPGGVSCSAGCVLKCPERCPNRTRFCSESGGEFKVDCVNVDSGEECNGNGLLRYTAKETGTYWNVKNTLQTYMDLDDNFAADEIEEFAGSEEDALEALEPRRSYDRIIVRKRVFSDNCDVRRNIALSRPLRGAMQAIFLNWETDVVFASRQNSDELNDEFVWLMVALSNRTVYKAEVDMILKNENYNRSQKFFHLFYDVIYSNNKPDGFYWCDGNSSFQPLVPRFKSKTDFIEYLLNDKLSGLEFYSERKSEVLSYLGIEDENKLFVEVTCSSIRDGKEVIWVDQKNSGKVKRLGTKDEFVRKMQRPTDLPTMRNMIGFMKEFCMDRHGVTARTSDIPFDEIRVDSVEQGLFDAMQIPRNDDSKAVFEAYLSLLNEYIKSFGPDIVKVGDLHFTRDNYGKEVCKLIEEFCQEALIYSEGSETSEYRKKKNRALLALTLKEKNLFKSFTVNNQGALDKKIEMFRAINSGSMKNMRDYLQGINAENVFDQCDEINNDELVNTWFDFVLPRNNSEIDGEVRRYTNLYNDFKI